MDATHEPNNNVITFILLTIGFISNLFAHAVQNYDYWFKIASLIAVGLGIIVNLDKAFKVIWRHFVSLYQWIKKK